LIDFRRLWGRLMLVERRALRLEGLTKALMFVSIVAAFLRQVSQAGFLLGILTPSMSCTKFVITLPY
jgi:hypothetical protein